MEATLGGSIKQTPLAADDLEPRAQPQHRRFAYEERNKAVYPILAKISTLMAVRHYLRDGERKKMVGIDVDK